MKNIIWFDTHQEKPPHYAISVVYELQQNETEIFTAIFSTVFTSIYHPLIIPLPDRRLIFYLIRSSFLRLVSVH